MIVSIEELCC